MSDDAELIINWFEENYVHRRVHRIFRNGEIRTNHPLFPPEICSVYEINGFGYPQTQNKVETWHRRNTLGESAHVWIFSIISEIRQKQSETYSEIENIIRG